jgi:hypothetical protein
MFGVALATYPGQKVLVNAWNWHWAGSFCSAWDPRAQSVSEGHRRASIALTSFPKRIPAAPAARSIASLRFEAGLVSTVRTPQITDLHVLI